MPESIVLDELWLKCRGVENAFRYYSDVLAAVGHDLKSRGLLPSGIPVTDPAARDGIQLTFPSVEHSVGPEECPPWCHISSPLTIEGLGTPVEDRRCRHQGRCDTHGDPSSGDGWRGTPQGLHH